MASRLPARFCWFLSLTLAFCGASAHGVAEEPVSAYRDWVAPLLEDNCFDCHANGSAEGGRAFDSQIQEELLEDTDFWWAVLRNVRSGLMPPPDYGELDQADRQRLLAWIKSSVFKIDPSEPDPGRRVMRRLNRVEYQNTIRDLLGVEFDARLVLPADDSGEGFDNLADALMLSPLLVEKYLDLGGDLVAKAIKQDRDRFFPPRDNPSDDQQQREYARSLLANFARSAFRRPVDDATIERLLDLAELVGKQEGRTFEDGIARAMSAVLASPRFLFRIDFPATDSPSKAWPLVDEYSLASRLSYLLWSTMPDPVLMSLAEEGQLRNELPGQVERMLKDDRAAAFVKNFSGQWLRTRDIEHVSIKPIAATGREDEFRELRHRSRALRESPGEHKEELAELKAKLQKLNGLSRSFGASLRRALRLETELLFQNIVQQDRSLLELIDCDYTYLNEELARHYGISGVKGKKMRKVAIPAGSPRGGVLTQGAMLAVTSNPSRTSPVKRGLFVLDNLLGTPPPPPPPDIPELEDAAAALADQNPTLRELLAAHRENPGCAACHNRMDPLGLALENFNAMGQWRDQENGKPIDPSGELVSGEAFAGVSELKKLLATTRREDFYRCVTQKLLVYATGRELEYYDEHTADTIVARLEAKEGRFVVLLTGVVNSAPFQRMRATPANQELSR